MDLYDWMRVTNSDGAWSPGGRDRKLQDGGVWRTHSLPRMGDAHSQQIKQMITSYLIIFPAFILSITHMPQGDNS